MDQGENQGLRVHYSKARGHSQPLPTRGRAACLMREMAPKVIQEIPRMPPTKHRATDFSEVLAEFLDTSLDTILEAAQKPDCVQAEVLRLLANAFEEVPAYAKLLSESGVDTSAVRSLSDFARLPLLDKATYVQRYPLADRCAGGELHAADMLAFSSGSTGSPTVWPRSQADELIVARRFEQVFRDSFRAHERSTLAVVCFALGTWIGGMFTASCCRLLASKGYLVTTVTPGNNRPEIYRVLKEMGARYEQIVLLGYPPFLKDVVDNGPASGVDWRAYRARLVLAGEVFSEEWRSLMGERLHGTDPLRESASLYGTADGGVLANETPLSIAIRRFLAGNPECAREIFGESRLPSLFQYDPIARYFETHQGTLLFSGRSIAPLVRYHIADKGGLLPFDQMLALVEKRGFSVPESAIAPLRKLPFVYVFGRADFTVSYFGANIYPENVTVALERGGIREWTSGKFVLEVAHDRDQNPELCVTVELAPGHPPSSEREREIAEAIVAELRRLNSEFAHYVPLESQRAKVRLLANGDPGYFPPGVKHRYTRR